MPAPRQPIVLASHSPRRQALMASAGFDVHVHVGHGQEHWPGGDAQAAAVSVARDKLKAAWTAKSRWGQEVDWPWLAADTAVVCHGRVFGKPADPDEARAMLEMLSGSTHEVVTGYVLRFFDMEQARAVTTRVTMRPFSDADIDRYLATGESKDKAGAYAIQGEGAGFIDRIEGSYTNVVGLPLAECLLSLEAVSAALTHAAERVEQSAFLQR